MGIVYMGMGLSLAFIGKMPVFRILLTLMVILGIFGYIEPDCNGIYFGSLWRQTREVY